MKFSQVISTFENILNEIDYFSDWKKTNLGEFQYTSKSFEARLVIHKDKLWSPNGGKVYIDFHAGHITELSDYNHLAEHLRVSPKGKDGKAWPIHSKKDLTHFEHYIKESLLNTCITWVSEISHPETYVKILDERLTTIDDFSESLFPIYLKFCGKDHTKQRVLYWLTTLPRGIEDTLSWAVQHSLFKSDLAAQIRLASFQAETTYSKQLNALIGASHSPPNTTSRI